MTFKFGNFKSRAIVAGLMACASGFGAEPAPLEPQECADLLIGSYQLALEANAPEGSQTTIQIEREPDGTYIIFATEVTHQSDVAFPPAPTRKRITCILRRFTPRGRLGGFTVQCLEMTDREGTFETIGPTLHYSAEAPSSRELLKSRRELARALSLHRTTVKEVARAQRIIWKRITGLDWDDEDRLTKSIAIATSPRMLTTVAEGVAEFGLSPKDLEMHLMGQRQMIVSFADDEEGDRKRRFVEFTLALQDMRQHHFKTEADSLARAILRRHNESWLSLPSRNSSVVH